MARKKGRHRRRGLQRRVNVRELRQRFLIVCEGEKTEPNYFNSFRVPGVVIDVRGIGENTVRLVERANSWRKTTTIRRGAYSTETFSP